MQTASFVAILGAATLNANAGVFAPWAAVTGAVGEVAQEAARTPVSGPFYRPEAPPAEAADATPAKIEIKPWYLTGGV